MKHKIFLFAISVFFIGNLFATAPVITSFSPSSGPVGSSVTITGAGFSAYPNSNIVFFGATQATVTAATTNSLTVTVPLGATYKYISVLNDDNGLTGYSAIPFNVTFQGNISFATKVNFSTSSSPNSVDIGDLDGDGKSDLVVTCAARLNLFRNTCTSGAVSFAGVHLPSAAGNDLKSACIGDLNGDGKPDLVEGNFNGWDVSIFKNKSWPGTLQFGTTGGISTGSGTPAYSSKSVSLGDIDGDGKPDLAVANYSTGKISVFRNTSTLSTINFESKVDFSTVYAPFWLSIGDLDGDGKPDMVVANRLNSSVSVFRNTSTSGTIDSGSFAASVAFTTGSFPRSIGLGDIDGDGKLDLAVANYSGSVSVLLNTSSSGSINFASKVDISTSGFPISVSVGDIDGDGKPDLVVPLTQTKAVGVFRNTSSSGSVSFAAEQDFAVGIDYWYSSGAISGTVGIGDINGDGKPDLSIFDNTNGNVSVLRQIIPAPNITSFTPTSAATGATVTITGTNFTGATTVSFGGSAATSYTVVDATTITAVVASGTTGSVSVTTPGGTATLGGFTFTANLTWTGATSTDWNTSTNWSTNAVPTASDNVTIPDVTNDPVAASGVGASCNNLTVENNALLTVQSGGSLITNGTVTGNVTIQREVAGSSTLTANKYHLVSVPLATNNNSLSGLFSGSYLYEYLPTSNTWLGMGNSSTTALYETVGYMIYYPGISTTYSFTGSPNTGTFTPSVTYHGHADGLNFALVPNPYPSNIDWNAASGWTKTNIGSSIWIYNNGNYGVWNGIGGTFDASRYIAVGQAFFVQTANASPSLIMGNGVRTHSGATFLKNTELVAQQLRVNAVANGMADELLVGFGETNSNDYSPYEDAVKFYGSEDAPQMYTMAGENKLTINALGNLSNGTIVPLNFETKFTGVVNLTFANMDSFDASMNIYLKDELTNQTINLRNQTAYTFNHNPANDANRFKLIFGGTYGIEEDESHAGNMWITGNTLYINTPKLAGEKAKVEVYNAAGQSLLTKNLVLDGLTTLDLNMQGFVIVKLTSGQTVLTAKGIFIK
jgi:hypothetical protein